MRQAKDEGEQGSRAFRGILALAYGALGSLGFAWGSFAVLLADLSRSLGLSPGPLGLALSGGMVASFPVMALAGRAADRKRRRPLLVVPAVLMGWASPGWPSWRATRRCSCPYCSSPPPRGRTTLGRTPPQWTTSGRAAGGGWP